jgi:sulfonate transport system substrate-binding protein
MIGGSVPSHLARFAVGVVCAALVFGAGVVLRPLRGGADPVVIRVAYGATPATMGGLVFEKTGVMRHYGKSYTVERSFFPASTQQIQGFAAKAIDVGFLAYPSFAFAVVNAQADLTIWGGGLRECVPGYYSQTWAVLGSSPIKAVEDLKGKRIAVPAFGTGTDGGLRIFLKKSGLDPQRDVSIVEVNWPNQEAMLRQGKVDAAVFLPDFWRAAVAKGDIRKVFDFCPGTGYVQTLVEVVRSDFLKEHRAAMQDFVEDYIRGLQWFLDPAHHKEAVDITAKFTKRPASAFEGWAFTKEDEYRDPWAWPDMAAFQRNVDQLYEIGMLPKKLDVTKYADLSLPTEAKKRIEK